MAELNILGSNLKASARASAVTDTAVLELAKRIRRKRAILSANPLLANSAPISSGQGFLRRLGLGKVDVIASPEITIAKILREWHELDALYWDAAFYRGGSYTAEEKAAHALKDLNDRIGLVEFRVFGLSPNDRYPKFKVLGEWLAWRLPLAHPEYGCGDASAGWVPLLFDFAVEDANLAFPTALFR